MKGYSISYTDAIVSHSNKYNQNTGLVISIFIFTNLLQDVVFKLEDGNEYSTTFKNLNLPLFTGQKVTLVAMNENVVAYVDKTTNEFYYLTKNLQRDLDYGPRISWPNIIVLTLLAFFTSSLLLQAEHPITLLILALPLCLWIYQRITNLVLEKRIDKLIASS